ncbi:MAG: FkbM family methyltransferase [Opitutaceae bacterium]|nr:FkbM family methyltransferase [Opitutaceae bacterium]
MNKKEVIYRAWARVAGRPWARKLNHFLLSLGARGLGVGNSVDLSGEQRMIERMSEIWRDMKRAPVFFDVGANEGAYSAMLRQFVPNARIYAFEPHPETGYRMKNRLKGTVNIIECAVGAKPGITTLWDYADGRGSSHASFEKAVIETIHASSAKGVDVRVVTLDGFCKDSGIEFVDFIKIDTEGFEADCLRGAASLIGERKVGIVQFEFNSMHALTGTLFQDMVRLLPGFQIYRILPHGWIMLDLNDIFRSHLYGIQNAVAVSPDLISSVRAIVDA